MIKEFGKYSIEKELGKGGMATVYLAMHRDLYRHVALKIMHPHLASEEQFRVRFELEARAIAQVEHINLLQVYDYGKQGDHYYIAMEYIDGEEAEQLVKKHGPFTAEVAAVVFHGVAAGLSEAHKKKIIHRDIKLSNIIIKNDGLVKLSDFGIVKMEDVAGLTNTQDVVGTPYYVSPEQIRGDKPSAQSDIFSLGVSLYFAVTGKFPFTAPTIPAIFNLISQGNYTPVRETGIYVPDELAFVISNCLEKEPRKRYDTVARVAEELNAFLHRHEISNDKDLVENYLKDPKGFAAGLKVRSITTKITRGKSFQEKGLIFEALKEYESILQLDPGNKEVKEHIVQIRQANPVTQDTSVTLDTILVPRRKKTGLMVAGVAAFLLLCVMGAGIYYSQQQRQHEAVRAQERWDSLSALREIDTIMFPALPRPEAVAVAAKAPPSAPRKAMQKKIIVPADARPAPLAEAKADTPTVQPAQPAHECFGYLFVFSEVWATILLDEKDYGKSPTKTKIKVPCGEYSLRLESPGGKRYTARAVITEEQTTRFQVGQADFQ